MLAACTGIPSAESQCVRDCCHLEGETPVEIRIAVHRRAPKLDQRHTGRVYDHWHTGSIYPEGISKLRDVGPTAGYADPFAGKLRDVGPSAGYADPFGGKYGSMHLPGEPQMPRMSYTYEGKRNAHEGRRESTPSFVDGFNPDTFAAPADDSEHALVQRACDSKLLPSSQVMKALSGEGHLPEVVRFPSTSSRSGDLEDVYSYGSTPSKSSRSRSEMPWTPGSLSSHHPPEPRVPHLREGPMEEEGAHNDSPFEMLARFDQCREQRCSSSGYAPLVRNSSGIFTPVSFSGL